MHFINKLVCMYRGHRPLGSIAVEPVPERIHTTRIGGTGLSQLAGMQSGAITISNNQQMHQAFGGAGGGAISSTFAPLKATEDYFISRNSNDATLHISAQGLSSKLNICARCQGVYWRTEPYLPVITSAHNVPELAEYVEWKKRELWEVKQRETNEAAGKLYKQYKMVLKLAGPTCDDPEEGQL